MKPINFVLLLAFFVALIGCKETKKKDIPETVIDMGDFAEVISKGEDYESFPSSRTVTTLEVLGTSNEDIDTEVEGQLLTERWSCTTETVSVLDGNGQFSLFEANSEVIYPGNLLQGETLNENPPRPIVIKRAGGTIFYDLNDGNPNSTVTVDEVTGGKIRQAMNNIIDSASNVVPANFALDIIEVQSQEQLALEMGLNVNTLTAQLGSTFEYNTDNQYNSFLVKLNQKYYSMNYELPTSYDEVFHESVTPEDLEADISENNPATFISSVTYGRIFYMLIESTSSSQEMRARLEATYGNFSNSVEGEVDVQSFNSLESTKIKVIAYGGSSSDGSFSIIGEGSIGEIADRLEESTDIRTGLPLSFQVRSLEHPDQIVGTEIATEFDITTCELKGILPPAGYSSLVDLFEDGYGAMLHIDGSIIAFFNKAGTQYAWYNGSSGQVLGVFDTNDPNGPFGGTMFNAIGAAVRFQDTRLYLFDETGLQCEILIYDPNTIGNSLPTGPIGTFRLENGSQLYYVNDIFGDTPNFQFANRGFSGATRIGASVIQFFGNPGNEWAKYSFTNGGSWTNPVSVENLHPVEEGENDDFGEHPFSKIQAATRIIFGGSTFRYLYINEDGDQLLERISTPNREYNGPWVIN